MTNRDLGVRMEQWGYDPKSPKDEMLFREELQSALNAINRVLS